ncbi:putative fatty acid hydroxylase [Lupinus albus]|uniref:Putative fatty acid hydroxylase n=1 Tax=Lupinus albus TaxID=3870 RepID=A0A6A4PH39_LUPAL|nr:putative fatty acid hydroxylase [Lupinus albus]
MLTLQSICLMVLQVGHLGEAYDEWVHQPIISKESPRLFESNFLEFFTRTVWWVIPIVWVPVAIWSISNSIRMGLTCPQVTKFVVIGIFVWTFLEYMLHRFLFHVKTKSYWGNTLHYLLHGCHHKHPMDGFRLVFPPAGGVILGILIWYSVKLLCAPSTAPAMFGGMVLGYVVYDCTHYYLHHSKPKNDISKNLKKYHSNHHYRLWNYGFGVTSPMWDLVFGTFPPPSKADSKSR